MSFERWFDGDADGERFQVYTDEDGIAHAVWSIAGKYHGSLAMTPREAERMHGVLGELLAQTRPTIPAPAGEDPDDQDEPSAGDEVRP